MLTSIVKFAFLVQYDGTNYHGFQRQPDTISTIQDELEKAFQKVFQEKIVVHPAGRTDAGVHSLGQIVHIQVSKIFVQENSLLFQKNKLIKYINSILPKDISISCYQKVENNFHARYSCISREYKYIIYNHPVYSPFFSKYSLWIQKPLNFKSMRKASRYLTGEHNFSSFTKNIYQNSKISLIRRIQYIKIKKKKSFLIFSIKGNSFLHNMIRIIIGTLIEVGLDKKKPKEIKIILCKKDRKKSGKTLASHALFFYKANYKNYFFDK